MVARLPLAVLAVAMITGFSCGVLCTMEQLVMEPLVLLLLAISIYVAGAATALCIRGEEHDLLAIYICPSGSKAHKTKDCRGSCGELYYCPRPLALHRAIQIEWCSHCK